MSSIKRTGPAPLPTTTRRPSVGCGSSAPAKTVSSCGGWVSKSTRTPAQKPSTGVGCGGWTAPKRPSQRQVSGCGQAGWGGTKVPSGC